MSFAEQMVSGLELMALGMGIVFSFLILLVFVLKAMSALAAKLAPAELELPQQTSRPVAQKKSADGEVIAVISAAVKKFRSSQK